MKVAQKKDKEHEKFKLRVLIEDWLEENSCSFQDEIITDLMVGIYKTFNKKW